MRSVPLPISIGQRLALLRKRARLTQEELAERAGVSARTVRRIERGQRPHDWTCLQLAAALGLGVADERWLCDPGLAAAAPPPPVDALIGAEAQVEAALALLADPRTTLLTVVGPGGVGKTALAREVAGRLADDRERPVAFVPLAAVGDPRDVLPTIAAALHAPGDGDPLGRLEHALFGRRLLLALDNLEHLTGALPDISALQRAAPGLSILATSRIALGLPRERRLRLGPLPADGPDAPAVRLFVRQAERAGAALDEDHVLETVAEICQRLGGLPLAIELAAAQAGALGAGHLLALLRTAGVTALPANAAAGTDPRQGSFAATFDWSWNLLDDAQRRLLRLLAVFAGGFDAEAAGAVLAGAAGLPRDVAARQAAAALADLAARSLVTGDPPAPVDLEPRYLLLEPIRNLALERLRAAGEEDAARRAHAEWALARWTALEAAMLGTDRPGVAIDRMERDYPNGRAALDWALAIGDRDLAGQLIEPAVLVWAYRERDDEGLRRVEHLLSYGDALTPRARIVARFIAADACFRLGDHERVRALSAEQRDVCRSLGQPVATATALLHLSAVEADAAAALALAREALDLLEPDLDWTRRPFVRGWATSRLGIELHRLGELDAAREALEEAVRIKREGGTMLMAQPLGHLALVLDDLGRPREAAATLLEGIARSEAIGTVWTTMRLAAWLVRLARERGGEDARRAAAPLHAALDAERRAGRFAPEERDGWSPAPASEPSPTLAEALDAVRGLAALLPERADPRPGPRPDLPRLE